MGAFGRYHPFVTMIYFAVVLLFTMFVGNPVIQATALMGGICFSLMLKKRGGFGLYFAMFCLIALTNPLFSHNGATPLFFLNGNAITLEAVIYGMGLALTVISVLIWFRTLNEIMTSDKILYLFGKLIPKLSLILSMTLRFVPMFIRQAKKMSRTQKALESDNNGFAEKIKNRMTVFSAVTAWAFENAIDTSASMKARGYGTSKRTNFSLFKFSIKDGIMLALIIISALICLTGVIAGKANFDYYPAISGIDVSWGGIVTYATYGILAFLPFIIEVKEALIWRYCVSKI